MSIYASLLEPDGDTLKILCVADIEPEQTAFLWEPYLPADKISLMQGDPGQGKTMLCLSLAAHISGGRLLPGEEGERQPGVVLYQTAEDGIADTIRPRLERMGADMRNIHFIDESSVPLSLTDERLERALQRLRPKLLIIDPLQAYLGAGVDMHRANQVRPVLTHLGNLAHQYRCAVLLVMHMSKMQGAKALYRGLGSIDFNAAARSVLMVGCNPKNPKEKIMAHAKSNLAAPGSSISFHIDSETGIVFDGFSDLNSDQILEPPHNHKSNRSEENKAAVLLQSFLQSAGYARLSEIYAAAEASGISRRTLYRAKQQMGLQDLTIGFKPKVTWWMLPNVDKDELRQRQKGVN